MAEHHLSLAQRLLSMLESQRFRKVFKLSDNI